MTWAWGDLKPQHYQTVLADPPWRFRTWSETNQKKSASRYYRLMPTKEIAALPVGDLAAKDCILFLWAINPMLPDAFAVIEAWGFKFKTIAFTWAKTTSKTDGSWAPKWHTGLGYWSRANTELCLLATRGKPKRIGKGVSQLIVAPRREHSRKPPEARARIAALADGPRCELFAREKDHRFDVWGNEVDHFGVAA